MGVWFRGESGWGRGDRGGWTSSRDIFGYRPGCFSQAGYFLCLIQGLAPIDAIFLAVDTAPDRIIRPHCFFHGLDNINQQTGAVLSATAISILTVVGRR